MAILVETLHSEAIAHDTLEQRICSQLIDCPIRRDRRPIADDSDNIPLPYLHGEYEKGLRSVSVVKPKIFRLYFRQAAPTIAAPRRRGSGAVATGLALKGSIGVVPSGANGFGGGVCTPMTRNTFWLFRSASCSA